MPRRFALALVALLLLLFTALLAGRAFLKPRLPVVTQPVKRPTPVIPPTPIPPQSVALYFESAADERLHPEPRDVPASPDKIMLLRSVASAVMDGPRHPDLLRPFPEGWKIRAVFLLKDGLAVIDLAPPVPEASPDAPAPAPAMPGTLHWQAGTHEEETAVQSLLVSVTRSLPEIGRVVVLVGGEPVETLGGHVDLTHPLHADPTRADELPLFEPPEPTPTPTVEPTLAAEPAPDALPGPQASSTPGPPASRRPQPPTTTPTTASKPPAVTQPTPRAPEAGSPPAEPAAPTRTPRAQSV